MRALLASLALVVAFTYGVRALGDALLTRTDAHAYAVLASAHVR